MMIPDAAKKPSIRRITNRLRRRVLISPGT